MTHQKKDLLAACYQVVNQRIGVVEKALKNAQEAANQETKSSAGDKYETGRAMMHLEKEKLSGQMSEVLKMKQALDMISADKTYETAALGAYVRTAQAQYFISASVGKIDLNGQAVFAISPVSPIGQQLLDKKAGDTLRFGGKAIEILEVS